MCEICVWKPDSSYWRTWTLFLTLQQAVSRNNTQLERKHIKSAFLFECIKECSQVGLVRCRALSLWLIPPGCRNVQKELFQLPELPLRCNTLFLLQSNTKVAACCFFRVFSLTPQLERRFSIFQSLTSTFSLCVHVTCLDGLSAFLLCHIKDFSKTRTLEFSLHAWKSQFSQISCCGIILPADLTDRQSVHSLL